MSSPYAPPAGAGLAPDWSKYYLNYVPEAGFWSYLQSKGLVGATPQDRFAQSRYSNYYGRYTAEAANDPNLGFFDYLQKQQFDPMAEYQSQSPDQRFDFTSRVMTPRARWTTR